MAYEILAEFYDTLNGDADYDTLFCVVKRYLQQYNIKSGIIADLGCGTGELTIMLAKEKYDMIAVDLSTEMLCVAREKAYENNLQSILFLQQDLCNLDLYGTVKAAICTFDTLNHIGPYENFCTAIERASLFLESGCPFIFDVNTPYKHKNILADNAFGDDDDEISYHWQNTIDEENNCTQISIIISEGDEEIGEELFYEYFYSLDEIENACKKANLTIKTILDGDTFTEITSTSQRYFIVALKN